MNNPLSDVIPAKARKYVYAAAFVGGLGLAAWQASGGDWQHAVAILAGDLIPALAASNVPDEPVEPVKPAPTPRPDNPFGEGH